MCSFGAGTTPVRSSARAAGHRARDGCVREEGRSHVHGERIASEVVRHRSKRCQVMDESRETFLVLARPTVQSAQTVFSRRSYDTKVHSRGCDQAPQKLASRARSARSHRAHQPTVVSSDKAARWAPCGAEGCRSPGATPGSCHLPHSRDARKRSARADRLARRRSIVKARFR